MAAPLGGPTSARPFHQDFFDYNVPRTDQQLNLTSYDYQEMEPWDLVEEGYSKFSALECIRIIWMSVAVLLTGTLVILVFRSIWRSRQFSWGFIGRMAFFLAFMVMSDLFDVAIFFDFYIFRVAVDFIHFGQVWAFALEFTHLAQRFLVVGIGLVELLRLISLESFFPTWHNPKSYWAVYGATGLMLPFSFILLRAWTGEVTALHFFEFILLPFLLSSGLALAIYKMALKMLLHMNMEEILTVKLTLFYLFLVICESVIFFLIEEIVWGVVERSSHTTIQLIYMVRDGVHEMAHFFYPIGYFLFLASRNGNTCWRFLPALNNPSWSMFQSQRLEDLIRAEEGEVETELDSLVCSHPNGPLDRGDVESEDRLLVSTRR